MLTENFRTVARALAPFIEDGVALLNATDAVLLAQKGATHDPATHSHDSLVAACLSSETILGLLVDTKKIAAIKELRAATSCGLKDAKDAVEDRRVVEVADQRRHDAAIEGLRAKLTGDPWGPVPNDPWLLDSQDDEPPF